MTGIKVFVLLLISPFKISQAMVHIFHPLYQFIYLFEPFNYFFLSMSPFYSSSDLFSRVKVWLMVLLLHQKPNQR